MKLYDGGKILIGLMVFVGIATFPFYYNIGKVNAKPELKTDTPAIQAWEKQYGKKECVESKEYMRSEHMQLLNNWRDSVVRDMNRQYVSMTSGRKFNMSLQNGCLECHSNKKQFCDQCHNYMAVKPYCFDCHIQPMEKEENKS
ncbi:MAG: sulfate reduction electron transfer complex DsrMKJOP subunit DsrJ [Nitrospiraceae bacterium]|nr:sulfate reduction electron transfer complex DsrMKJOP subunit DsrJ [Nitrospiraceae bacterium]